MEKLCNLLAVNDDIWIFRLAMLAWARADQSATITFMHRHVSSRPDL